MKSRILWALIAGATCAVCLSGSTAEAQSTDSTRSYEQALRFESYWGNAKIIRGADGPIVGTAGWFRSFDVEQVVASSSAARAEARVFKTNNFRGSAVTSIGALAAVVGVVVASKGSNAASPILIIGGVGAMGWGVHHLNKATAALSRSLWWYNRDLVR